MASRSQVISSPAETPGFLLPIKLLLVLALLMSAYLGWITLSGGRAFGCGPESGCADVLKSRWAYWFGLPVSLMGVLAYLMTLAGTLQIGPGKPTRTQRRGWLLALPGAVLILAGALWFTGLQWLVIRSFCYWCLGTHAAASIAAVLLLMQLPPASSPAKGKKSKGKPPLLRRTLKARLVGAALLVAVLFTAGQILHKPKSFVVESTKGAVTVQTNTPSTPPPAAPQSSEPAPSPDPAQRVLSLFNGQVKLDLADVPLIGSPDAPHVMVDLHDYTCKGCRQMHHPLHELQRLFGDQLAIVSLPLPLDATCNPAVPRTPSAHVNACQYAQIGLAVWRARPESLPAYEDFVFGPTTPPSVQETVDFARQLVGPQALGEALSDPWVKATLQKSIQIFVANLQATGRSSMPQFLMGTNVIFGSLSMDELVEHATNSFSLSLP